MENEESALPPAVDPVDLRPAEPVDLRPATVQPAYSAFVKVLRAQGCRCPLMWNGVICVPATVCDLQEPGTVDRHVCKVLQSLPPVPEKGSTSDARLLGPTAGQARQLDAEPPSAGD